MPELQRPLKVFLCHAHADRDAVRGLYTRLTKDGVDAWLDKERLLPGQDWELEIRKAVREADVVVVCLSRQFNQAGFRQKEVRLALDTAMEQPEGEIFIIPARLEECDTPESLRKWHWVDLFEEDGYERLIRTLQTQANKIGAILQTNKGWLLNITPSLLAHQKIVATENTLGQETSELKLEPKRKLSIKQVVARTALVLLGMTSTLVLVFSLVNPLIEKWFSSVPIEAVTSTFSVTLRPSIPSQTLESIQTSNIPIITILPAENLTPTSTTDGTAKVAINTPLFPPKGFGALEVKALDGCKLFFNITVNGQEVGSGGIGVETLIVPGTYDVVFSVSIGENPVRKGVIIREGQKTVIDFSDDLGTIRLEKPSDMTDPRRDGPSFGFRNVYPRISPLILDNEYCMSAGSYELIIPASIPQFPGIESIEITINGGEQTVLQTGVWAKNLGAIVIPEDIEAKIINIQTSEEVEDNFFHDRHYWAQAGFYQIIVRRPYIGLTRDVEIKAGEVITLELP